MDLEYSIPNDYRDNHYSTKLWRGLYNYLTRHQLEEHFVQVANELKVPPEFLLRDNNWVSDKFLTDFMNLLVARIGDQDILNKVGADTISPEAMNPAEYTLHSLILFPYLFFSSIVWHYSKYNQKNNLIVRNKRPGLFVFEVSSKDGRKYSEHVCKNMVGVLTGIDKFFHFNHITVDHSKCIHHGHNVCEFSVKYGARRYYLRRFASIAPWFILAAVTYLTTGWLRKITSSSLIDAALSSFSVLCTAVVVLLGTSLWKLLKQINLYNEQANEKNRELTDNYRKLDKRFNESVLLRELSLRLVNTYETGKVLNECLYQLKERFGFARGMSMLLSGDASALYTSDVIGFDDAQLLFNLRLEYPAAKENQFLFAKVLEAGHSVLISDLLSYSKNLKEGNKALVSMLDVTSLIVAPIQDEKNKYGLLIVGSVGSDRVLNKDDLQIIDSVVHLLSLSFQNAKNFENEKTLRVVLRKYVPAVMQSGIDVLTQARAGLEPKYSNVTAVFIDLRGFTALCEHMQPARALEMLNIYMDYTCRILSAHGAVLDKLVADSIVAYFTVRERERQRHARVAMLAALEILADLNTLQDRLKARGFERVSLGIGIHSGEVILGIVGSELKTDYTAIGDTMNVASRLETLTKTYHRVGLPATEGLLIVSESTFNRAQLNMSPLSVGDQDIRGRTGKESLLLIDQTTAQNFMSARKVA